MRRLILLLFILIAFAILAQSKTSVPLSGAGGISLLKSMANVTSDLTENNNTTLNLSRIPSSAELSGIEGTELLSNLTNGSSNLSGRNRTDGNLSTWGSKPRDPPPPPDLKNVQLYQVIRDNHLP